MEITPQPARCQTETAVNAAPPRMDAPRLAIPWVLLSVSVVVLAGMLILFYFDPAQHAFYPFCTFKKTTGYDCPGCGGLRALHQLLRGDVGGAFRLNALVVVTLPAILLWLGLRWRRNARGRRLTSRQMLVLALTLVLAILVFGVARNLPFWPFGVTPP